MLVMTLLVKNEIDIIACNIDYHLNSGVDHIIITDNSSDDGTRDLLADYSRLSEVTVWDEAGDDYSQHRWVTKMAMAASALGADWILNNDADEFWLGDKDNLNVSLANRTAHVQMCARCNMFSGSDATTDEPWWHGLIYRMRNPPSPRSLTEPLTDPLLYPHFACALPGKAALRPEGLVRVHQGNHSADYDRDVETEPGPIRIYHYPVRSARQFEAKILQGAAAYARNTELSSRVGWHWRRWHKMISETGDLSAVLAEAVLSTLDVAQGLASGDVIEDRSMVGPLERVTSIAANR